MTVTDRAIGWLDQNRHRSYPLERDGWRRVASATSGLDCVILDAMLFDQCASGDEEMVLESIQVTQEKTIVTVSYGGVKINVETLPDGTGRAYETVNLKFNVGDRKASVTMSFSSHEYILENVGEGIWKFGCRFLKSRCISLSEGSGVSGISSNGSSGVDGHGDSSTAAGSIVLEDGYRTSPIIWNGEVFVRVGRRYGLDPCRYDYGEDGSRDCRKPLFFFCGQNAINGGNIVIKGGRGISVAQGRTYEVRDRNSRMFGKSVPCVEIIAGKELSDICSVE